MNKNEFEFESLLGLKSHSVVVFGGRKFYLPLVSYIITYSNDGNCLDIDLQGNDDAYCLVSGVRCYSFIRYEKSTDMVTTSIREYVYIPEGTSGNLLTQVTFKFDAKQLAFTGKVIELKRHYEELADSFLAECPKIDGRIRNFLKRHPECFGNTPNKADDLSNYVQAWCQLHNILYKFEHDAEIKETVGDITDITDTVLLDDNVFKLFCKEELGNTRR